WVLADDAETAGPADLLADREGQLQKPDGFQLTGAAQGSGIDRVDSAGQDRRRQGCFRVSVVTGDQHGRLVRANLLGTQGGREGRVERLEHLRGRQRGREFGGSGAVRG